VPSLGTHSPSAALAVPAVPTNPMNTLPSPKMNSASPAIDLVVMPLRM
jgi:hypothetical protein